MTAKKNAFQLIIPRRGPCCIAGNELFKEGMEYISVLQIGAEEGSYDRLDYCLCCWDLLCKRNSDAKGVIPHMRSYWRVTVPVKEKLSDLPKQRNARALYLLKEALSDKDNNREAEAFVLSLYLARKRRILFRHEIKLENGQITTLYEIPETEEMISVPKIALTELHVDKVQGELAKKMALTL